MANKKDPRLVRKYYELAQPITVKGKKYAKGDKIKLTEEGYKYFKSKKIVE